MLSSHKQKRFKKRYRWKKIKKLDEQLDLPSIKFSGYTKLKKYEKKKKKQNKNPEKSVISCIDLHKTIDFKDGIENITALTNSINKYLKYSLMKKFVINHKVIDDASIAGILYLVGQISKIQKVKSTFSQLKMNYSKKYGLKKDKHKLQYLFYKIGYWRYFGIDKPYSITQDIKNDYFLSIGTNHKSDINLLNKIKEFIKENVNFFQDDYELEYNFDDILKEAMGNSIEHAYSENFNEVGKELGRWWVCGHFDKQNNILELVFYDYGIGIRNSMKKNLGEDADIALIDKFTDKIKNDADIIEMAINGNLSKYKKYKEQDRGKGFNRFQNFAKSSGHDCELTIVSNKGKYQFKYDNLEAEESVKKTVLSSNIDGTLVKWKIKLNRKDSLCQM